LPGPDRGQERTLAFPQSRRLNRAKDQIWHTILHNCKGNRPQGYKGTMALTDGSIPCLFLPPRPKNSKPTLGPQTPAGQGQLSLSWLFNTVRMDCQRLFASSLLRSGVGTLTGKEGGLAYRPPLFAVHFLCTIQGKAGANNGKSDRCLSRAFPTPATTCQPVLKSCPRADLIRNHQVGGSSPPAGSK
jgi:hypothetical protein